MNHEAAAATICRQGREKGAKFQGGAQKGRKTHILTIILSCITMNCACFCKFQIGKELTTSANTFYSQIFIK